MAYQNMGTPRFYIDVMQYIRTTGQGFPSPAANQDIFNLNPSSFLGNQDAHPTWGSSRYWNFGIAFPQDEDQSGDAYDEASLINNVYWGKLNYISILGHNLGSSVSWDDGGLINLGWRDNVQYDSQSDVAISNRNITEVVNFQNYNYIELDGYSIATFDDYIFNGINLYVPVKYSTQTIKIASLGLGCYYDMPHSPELSLTMSREYKGTSKQTTMGGATLTNTNYYKPPKWGDLEAWQLGGYPARNSGRRVWDLAFNYISDSDLEPSHYNMREEEVMENTWKDNWFSNVLYYTMGGTLPFIFQPNKDDTYQISNGEIVNIPEFAICRLDMDTFSREQVAPSIYNIKVKIKEAW